MVIVAKEQWRPIRGWEGKYEVSDMGRVRSLTRQVAGKYDSVRTVQGRILRPRIRSDGTPAVNLWEGNVYEQKPVKRLVLEAFVRRQPNGYDAKNIDDDPANNRLDNLRWEPVAGMAALRHRLGR